MRKIKIGLKVSALLLVRCVFSNACLSSSFATDIKKKKK